MSNTKIKIEENNLVIQVPTELVKEKINTEKTFLLQLRDSFSTELFIKYDISPELFPEFQTIPVKKLLTNKEKYHALIEKNPDVLKLIEKLKLKYDNS